MNTRERARDRQRIADTLAAVRARLPVRPPFPGYVQTWQRPGWLDALARVVTEDRRGRYPVAALIWAGDTDWPMDTPWLHRRVSPQFVKALTRIAPDAWRWPP